MDIREDKIKSKHEGMGLAARLGGSFLPPGPPVALDRLRHHLSMSLQKLSPLKFHHAKIFQLR